MRISKKQLSRIILETKKLHEQWGWGSEVETGSFLIAFAKAYDSLGSSVQGQVDAVVSAYFNSGGGPSSEEFEGVVVRQNLNALELARDRLRRPASMLGDEAKEILEALNAAIQLHEDHEGEIDES